MFSNDYSRFGIERNNFQNIEVVSLLIKFRRLALTVLREPMKIFSLVKYSGLKFKLSFIHMVDHPRLFH